jgi:transcriptional regulator with XRE-family HTH domain
VAEDDNGARVAGFGRYLLQERELRGLSREEVSRLTKLAPMVIDALESGEPQRMPARAYLLGYLRAYAGAVGLDPDEVVLRWQEVAVVEAPAPPGRSPPGPWRLVLVAALAALIVAALVAALVLGPRLASGWSRHGAPSERSAEGAGQ